MRSGIRFLFLPKTSDGIFLPNNRLSRPGPPQHPVNEDSLLKIPKFNHTKNLATNNTDPIDGIIQNFDKLVIDTAVSKNFKVVACQAYNKAGSDRKSSAIEILKPFELKVKPEINMPIPVIQENKQPLNISCNFNVPLKSIAIFGWYKNGFLMPKVRSHIYQVKKPSFNDSGVYTCVASRIELPDMIKTDSLTIQVVSSPILEVTGLENNAIEVKHDKKLAHVKYVEMDSGNSLKYVCAANNNPKAKVNWIREFMPQQIQNKETVTIEKIDNTTLAVVELKDVTEGDSGKFECIASNIEISLGKNSTKIKRGNTTQLSSGSVGGATTHNLPSSHSDTSDIQTYTLKQTIFLRVKKWVPHFTVQNGQVSYMSLPMDAKNWINKFSFAMGFRPDPISGFSDDGQIPGADGVLLFADDKEGGGNNFIWLGVHRGQVEFRFDLGGGPAKLRVWWSTNDFFLNNRNFYFIIN